MMLPEVDRYLKACKLADTEYDEEGQQTRDWDEAYDAYLGKVSAAWEELRTSSHPLIAWLATNIGYNDFESEIKIALEIITNETTLTDLDDLARINRWCSAYRRIRERIVMDGILKDPADPKICTRVNGSLNNYVVPLTSNSGYTFPEEPIREFFKHGIDRVTFQTGEHVIEYYLA